MGGSKWILEVLFWKIWWGQLNSIIIIIIIIRDRIFSDKNANPDPKIETKNQKIGYKNNYKG